MARNSENEHARLGPEQGSAFVLTLLFILLLTTMSTGLYLYSSQQALFADASYTAVAASYVAEAGLEAGKSVIARQDPVLDSAGQNPNGRIEKDDYPVFLPGPMQVGDRYGTSGKQGVGSYTTVIDADFADEVEMQVRLIRDFSYIIANYDPGAAAPPTTGILNKLYSFVNGKVLLTQNGETLNEFALNSQKEILWFLQVPGTFEYEWTFDETMNPFAGRNYKLEVGRTPFDLTKPSTEVDSYGNPLILFPNNDCGGAVDCSDPEIITDRTGANAIALSPHKDPNGTYLVRVYNPYRLPVEVKAIYDDLMGVHVEEILVNSGTWGATDVDRYAVLQFNGIHANLQKPTVAPGHPLSSFLSNSQIVIEISSGGAITPAQPVHFTVSRGDNTPLDVDYRMRTQKMWDTCTSLPTDLDCCWFPDWPGSNCTAQSFALNVIQLGEHVNFGTYDLNPDLEILDREHAIRVDELYTVSATGNVERATKARQLLLTPRSFLDYARFVEGNLAIGEGTSYTGEVYARGLIDLRQDTGTSTIDFYADVFTSNTFQDLNNLAQWFDAELHTFTPVQELPDAGQLIGYYYKLASPALGGYGYIFPDGSDIFLGNYDYLNKSNSFFGFYFVDPDPTDDDDVARYYPPGPGIRDEDSKYPLPYAPAGAGFYDLTSSSPSGNRIFNGIIYVDGDCTVWGKLAGRSLTIIAKGDITVNREIIMGTDVVDTSYPHRCFGEGYPVHLGLIACNQSSPSKITISQYSPRIMQIEAALMSIGGTWLVEDNDWTPGSTPLASGIDTDNSHAYYDIRPCGSFDTCWTNVTNPGALDLNRDGQISTSVQGWDENNVNATYGHDYIWLLDIKGPILTSSVGVPGPYQVRRSINYNQPTAGRTRIYRYDPSIKFNPPPYFPVPRHSLKILEWSTAIVELPS